MKPPRDVKSPRDAEAITRPERLCNLGRLVDTLDQRGLDGLVSYLRPNVFYLSGFAPPASASIQETNGYAAVVISRHEPEHPIIVLAEFDLAHFLLQPSWVKDARPYATLLTPFDVAWKPLDHFLPAGLRGSPRAEAARGHYAANLVEGTVRAMQDLGLARGVVGFDDLRFANALAVPGVQVVDAYGTLKYVRQVKTGHEVSLLRQATRLNQQAITQAVRGWSPGMTWQELTRVYHTAAVSLGGFVRDPGAIVMANPPGIEPAFFTQSGLEDFTVEPGMHVMWDCHGSWAHYCWDGGKTWVVADQARGLARQIAAATAAGMAEIQHAMRPGVKISQLQTCGRETLRRAGLANADDAFIFFHGLGLEHIDMEVPASRYDFRLEAGMVAAVHLQIPGDDRHRSWLEEIFLVTPEGGDPFFTWGNAPLEGDQVG
jgi:Xaa-Pro aminopeptidase